MELIRAVAMRRNGSLIRDAFMGFDALVGGVIVVGSLAVYLWHTGRRRMAQAG